MIPVIIVPIRFNVDFRYNASQRDNSVLLDATSETDAEEQARQWAREPITIISINKKD